MADGSGWIYISSGNTWGFIRLSDFPGIDYLLTEYHYYDQGYNLRFGSAEDKIYSYASVLNDVMMNCFGLKVNPYVCAYTSAADDCKILRYGSVKSSNLSSSCPKTSGHSGNSCLTTASLRSKLINDKGKGTPFGTKSVWTGHIMDGHKSSNSAFSSQTLVFTTANTVTYKKSSNTYLNKSEEWIKYYSKYEIVHETGHQLGLHDGYCYKDGGTEHCSNVYCYSCNGKTIPNCIMAKIVSPNSDSKVFCKDCVASINNHLNDHH